NAFKSSPGKPALLRRSAAGSFREESLAGWQLAALAFTQTRLSEREYHWANSGITWNFRFTFIASICQLFLLGHSAKNLFCSSGPGPMEPMHSGIDQKRLLRGEKLQQIFPNQVKTGSPEQNCRGKSCILPRESRINRPI